MTIRLPIPGGDNGTWGDILNSFLDVSHNSDGTIKDSAIGSSQLQAGSVTITQLDSTVQSTLSKADGSVQSVNSIIPDSSGAINLTATDVNADTLGSASTAQINAQAYADSHFPPLSTTYTQSPEQLSLFSGSFPEADGDLTLSYWRVTENTGDASTHISQGYNIGVNEPAKSDEPSLYLDIERFHNSTTSETFWNAGILWQEGSNPTLVNLGGNRILPLSIQMTAGGASGSGTPRVLFQVGQAALEGSVFTVADTANNTMLRLGKSVLTGASLAAWSFYTHILAESGNSVVIGTSALSLTATSGHLHIPTCAGQPTGAPSVWGSSVPLVFDTVNNKLWIYTSGSWKGTTVA